MTLNEAIIRDLGISLSALTIEAKKEDALPLIFEGSSGYLEFPKADPNDVIEIKFYEK